MASTLKQFGFIASKCDNSLFIKNFNGVILYVLVYVDDIIVTGNSKTAITALVTQLSSVFALKDLGDLNYFLGIEVQKLLDGSLHLNQTKYACELLERFNMSNCKASPTPMATRTKVHSVNSSSFHDSSLYCSVVGALQYLTVTRLELS